MAAYSAEQLIIPKDLLRGLLPWAQGHLAKKHIVFAGTVLGVRAQPLITARMIQPNLVANASVSIE